MAWQSNNFFLYDADVTGKELDSLVKNFNRFLDAYESYGQNAVSLTWSIPVDPETGVFLDDYTNSPPWLIDPPSPQALQALTEAAHTRGFEVSWKPHFVTDEPNAGNVNKFYVDAGFNPETFLAEVTAFWDGLAPLAQESGVDMLILGTENDDYAVGSYEADWRQIIANVRSVFSGDLTYDALGYVGTPGGESGGAAADDIEFWDALDHIGISMYVPLNTGGPKTLENATDELYENQMGGWHVWPPVNVPEILQSLAETYGKDIIFTEAGSQAREGALENPAYADGDQDYWEQSVIYAVLMKEFSKFDWFEGFSWWNNDSDFAPAPGTKGWMNWSRKLPAEYGFVEKPAGDIVRGFWLFGNEGAPMEGEFLLGNRFAETLTGGSLGDLIVAAGGKDSVTGGFGNDRLFGGDGADKVSGGFGDDILFGGSSYRDSNDVITGAAGADKICGGAGNDRIAGGSEADLFLFYNHDGRDTISDFEVGIDQIAIETGARKFSQLHFEKTGDGVIVSFSDVQLVLLHEKLAKIDDAGNFVFWSVSFMEQAREPLPGNHTRTFADDDVSFTLGATGTSKATTGAHGINTG
ncbi:hypothetical protein IHQ71_21790 [Rhizobium sp. TH2]|uniref:glycoside hydrolase family 113 n=1 Tax=Rhizobium sp. TH2 TaxID=2775403 RepID=UPI0021577707|nr:hypothetical protein [Rhizobium sp. TH2]UVC07792.1 hypothetical protein IHQ71_21790 [Rhizobium sp. TH2]